MDQDPTKDGTQRRSDGQQTHQAILETAMRLASIEGLGSLTFGRLARELDVTKSGVFAHFRSKQDLQEETIQAARRVFEREVLAPGLAAPEGLPRLEGLCESYLSYVERGVFPGGCFFAHLLAEFDAPPGPLHDQVVAAQRGWLGLLSGQIRAAQKHGELDPGTDAEQLAFELYAPMQLANYLFTLFDDPALLERGRTAVRATLARAGRSERPSGASDR